jgi:Lar family restriction alleviation protein
MSPGGVDLLPCPFCGGEAATYKESRDERFGYRALNRVSCQSCGAQVHVNDPGDVNGWAIDNAMPEAIAAWNRRAPPPAVVDALREALERIANTDLLEVAGYYTHKWCVPETGNEYESRTPIFKRGSYQNAEEFQAIARAALRGTPHE